MTDDIRLTSDPAEEIGLTQGWQIDDLQGLEWALERIGELLLEVKENELLGDQAINRIKARVAAMTERAEKGVTFFEAAIKAYAAAHRDELLKGGKKKSRELPGGTVGWRKGGGRIKVVDEAAYLQWARGQLVEEDFLRVKVEPNKIGLQAHFKDTGEVPPGCEVEEDVEEIYVKPLVPEARLGAPVPAPALEVPAESRLTVVPTTAAKRVRVTGPNGEKLL